MEANSFIFRINNKTSMLVSISLQSLYKKHFHHRRIKILTCSALQVPSGGVTRHPLLLPAVTDLHFSAKILPHTGSLGTRGADKDCTNLAYNTY